MARTKKNKKEEIKQQEEGNAELNRNHEDGKEEEENG